MPEGTNFFKSCLRLFVIGSFLLCYSFEVWAQGFKSTISLTTSAIIKNTGEKPQSKVWNYDGKWWSVFSISTGTYIWRLDGTAWTNVLKISSSISVEADCKVLDNVSHIFLWRNENNASQLISLNTGPQMLAAGLFTSIISRLATKSRLMKL